MKYVHEFRDSKAIAKLTQEILAMTTKPWRLMEVCGGQTHSIVKYQLDRLLSSRIELIHGPGCPVCVTPQSVIDKAVLLSFEKNTRIFTFGDMLRVRGSSRSLMEARAQGGSVDIVYSPLDAVQWALEHPETNVVFLAIGFETTSVPNALSVLRAKSLQLKNYFLLTHQVRVPPAIEMILQSSSHSIQGILAAGHVCTVMGESEYGPLVSRFNVPIVMTGFEPVDILLGIRETIEQLEKGKALLSNQYKRSIRPSGNGRSVDILQTVFEVGDQEWRGLGIIPQSGLHLSLDYSEFDAHKKWTLETPSLIVDEHNKCLAADVLLGLIKPPQCPHFGKTCRPENPRGAPMVSSEGACAAYFQYSDF